MTAVDDTKNYGNLAADIQNVSIGLDEARQKADAFKDACQRVSLELAAWTQRIQETNTNLQAAAVQPAHENRWTQADSLEAEKQAVSEHFSAVKRLRDADLASADEHLRSRSEISQRLAALENQALSRQAASYKNAALNVARILGAGRKEQAYIEGGYAIVQAALSIAKAFGPPPDPQAALAAIAWTAAARQAFAYAGKGGGAAKSSAGSAGRSSDKAASPVPEPAEIQKTRSRIVVNLDPAVAIVDRYEFARYLLEAINENMADNVVLELGT